MRRSALWAAYAVYLVAVAYLVWDPRPSVPSSAVLHVTEALNRLGIAISASLVEFGLNVLMFVPLSLLGAFVFRRFRVADWVLVGFTASFVVEVVQKLLLPTRTGSSRDIVANTLGALVGAVLAWLTLVVLERQGWWLPRTNPSRPERRHAEPDSRGLWPDADPAPPAADEARS